MQEEVNITPNQLEFGDGNHEAIQHTCDAIGRIIENWGFKKIMGMIWAFLYLCPEAASAKDICKALGVSPALVSITLQDLLRWQVVRKISPLGKRRDYYIAEHDIWKMLRKVFRERERLLMEHVEENLGQALKALNEEQKAHPELKRRRTCQFQKIRIEDLLGVTHSAQNLLDIFIEMGKLDVSPIYKALKPSSIFTKGLKDS